MWTKHVGGHCSIYMTDLEASEVNFSLEVTKGVIAKFVMAGLGFVGTVIFARELGPSLIGRYYLLLSLVHLLSRPVAGVSVAAKKRFSEVRDNGDEILGGLLVATAISIFVMAFVAYLARSWLTSYTHLSSAYILFVLLFATITTFSTTQTLLDGTGRVGNTLIIDTFRSVVTLPVQYAFAIAAGLGAIGMVYGLVTATVLAIPITLWHLGLSPRLPKREIISSLWKYARYSSPSLIVGKAYDRYDTLLLGLIFVPAIASNYEVAYRLTIPATFVASVAGSGLMSRVSNLASDGKRVGQEISNALAFASVLAVPLFFGALVLAEPTVVTAFGPEFKDAAPYLVGLGFYQVVYTQRDVLSQALSGLDRPDLNLRIGFGALVFNIVLGLALVYTIGPIGVVFATVLAEALRYGASVLMLKRLTDEIELFPRQFIEQVGAAIVMTVGVVAVNSHVSINSWFDYGLVVGTGGIIYGLVLLTISIQLRNTVRSTLP